MRILHLIDAVELYGAEKIVLELMERHRERGWHTVLGGVGGEMNAERPFETAARDRGLLVERFPMARGPNALGGRRIVQFANSNAFDLIHSHSYKPNINLGLCGKSIRSQPLLMTLHGWRPPRTLVARLIQRLESWAIQRADHVVAVDQKIAADGRLALMHSSQISIIPNGFHLASAQRDNLIEEQIARFTSGRFSVAAIGRLSHEKGFDVLLNALAKLSAQGDEIAVAIFGEGEERHRLAQVIDEANQRSRVKLFGYVGNAASYLELFDCLVIPSRSEGCPLVAIEGMRAQTPIVASRVGGLPTMLNDGSAGWLVEPDSISGLADTLAEVSRNANEAKKRTEIAARIVCQDFCPERMAANYAELYSRLVSEFASCRR